MSSIPFCLWFTGLPSSGKTTLGQETSKKLQEQSLKTVFLDGDVVRHGLCGDLGFSQEDRSENIRRAAEVSALFTQNGTISIVTFISPFEKDRQLARQIHESKNIPFFLIHLTTSLEICEQRDVKNLYKLARQNKIKEMTGIDSPFENPETADVVLDTNLLSVHECVEQIILCLKTKFDFISPLNDSELSKKSELEQNNIEICIPLTKIDTEWVQVVSEGWAKPLTGFMNETQYLQCLHFSMIKEKSTKKWHVMPLPIVLSISEEDKKSIEESRVNAVSLKYNDQIIGSLHNIQIYSHRKKERVARKFGTSSIGHPSIKIIMANSDWLVGGDINVFDKITWNDGLDQFRLTPTEIKNIIKNQGHDAVVAFQLRNPIHNGHALLMNSTLEELIKKGYKNPVLLLHPLGGSTKDDDVPLYYRIKQHQALLEEGVLDPKRTILAIFPSPMSYAGPTEVLWHCKARINCGADFYIVGRDPAGLPDPDNPSCDLYDPTHGAKILTNSPLAEELKVIPFTVVAYNKIRKTMEIFDPERKDEFQFISGTKMRSIAKAGEKLPEGFMNEKAWQIISEYYINKLNNS